MSIPSFATVVTAAGLLGGAAVTPLHAAVITVTPSDDVNAAIAAAAPGDTILFSPGSYDGPLVVGFGKTGLTLRGKGQVVIDARPAGVAAGPGVTVQSPGVTLQGLTIQHALPGQSDGGEGVLTDDGSGGDIDGLVLRDVTVLHCAGAGASILGNDAVIDHSVFEGTGGLAITGDDASVSATSVRNTVGTALAITGSDGTVLKCRITTADDGEGIVVIGLNPRVEGNTVSGTELAAITVDGDNLRVAKNTVHDCSLGIVVSNATIGTVEANKILDCLSRGLTNFGTGLLIRKNTVSACGLTIDAAYHLQGNNCAVESNTAIDCAGPGFLVKGDGNTLTGNKALDNLTDGFRVTGGDGNVIENCLAAGNRGEGFQNDESILPGDATNTTLRHCKAKSNRIDVAVVTAFATFDANSFSTGGNDPLINEPEIEE